MFGRNVGIAALVGTAIAGVKALLPSDSASQHVVLGLAALVGLPAYLAFPVWPILLARKVLRDEIAAAGHAQQFITYSRGSS